MNDAVTRLRAFAKQALDIGPPTEQTKISFYEFGVDICAVLDRLSVAETKLEAAERRVTQTHDYYVDNWGVEQAELMRRLESAERLLREAQDIVEQYAPGFTVWLEECERFSEGNEDGGRDE